MIDQAAIDQYGGKAATLLYLQKAIPGIPIPPFVVKQFDTPLSSIAADIENLKEPFIVRSSSPHEFSNFEGIFRSVPRIGVHGLEGALSDVEASATDDFAQMYAEVNGFTIDKRIHAIIQQ